MMFLQTQLFLSMLQPLGWPCKNIPLLQMQELAHYWEKEFEWRKAEAQINSFSNYEMRVNGIEVKAL